MSIKICVIGGGSVFTPELIQLLGKNTKVTGPVDVCLMDISSERLQIVGEMCQRLIKKTKEPVNITMTTDPREAIQGADYICNQLRAGGVLARIEDEKLGRKYKIPFTETISVCGFATYLRSFPEIVELANLILKYAPEAWVLNFANPAGMLSETFFRLGVTKVIGVCNISEKFLDIISEELAVTPSDVYMNFRGLNHMTFVDKVYVKGQELFSKVMNGYDPEKADLPFPKDLIQVLQFIPNPYLQYYFLKDKVVEHLQSQKKNRSEIVLELESELLSLYKTVDEIPDQLKSRGGYGYSKVVAGLILDMIVDGGNVHYAIVRNGSTLKEIPEDGFVEVPVLANKNRIQALQVDPLPEVVRPLVMTMKAYEDMLINASLNKDRNMLLKSLMLHPLIPSFNAAKSLLEDVLVVNASYLDWLKT